MQGQQTTGKRVSNSPQVQAVEQQAVAPQPPQQPGTGVVAVLLPGHSWEVDVRESARRLVASLTGLADALLVLGQPPPPTGDLPLIRHDIEWGDDAGAALNAAAAAVAAQRPSARWLLVLRAHETLHLPSGPAALLAYLRSGGHRPFAFCHDRETAAWVSALVQGADGGTSRLRLASAATQPASCQCPSAHPLPVPAGVPGQAAAGGALFRPAQPRVCAGGAW